MSCPAERNTAQSPTSSVSSSFPILLWDLGVSKACIPIYMDFIFGSECPELVYSLSSSLIWHTSFGKLCMSFSGRVMLMPSSPNFNQFLKIFFFGWGEGWPVCSTLLLAIISTPSVPPYPIQGKFTGMRKLASLGRYFSHQGLLLVSAGVLWGHSHSGKHRSVL